MQQIHKSFTALIVIVFLAHSASAQISVGYAKQYTATLEGSQTIRNQFSLHPNQWWNDFYVFSNFGLNSKWQLQVGVSTTSKMLARQGTFKGLPMQMHITQTPTIIEATPMYNLVSNAKFKACIGAGLPFISTALILKDNNPVETIWLETKRNNTIGLLAAASAQYRIWDRLTANAMLKSIYTIGALQNQYAWLPQASVGLAFDIKK
jgi:hypothetical protein